MHRTHRVKWLDFGRVRKYCENRLLASSCVSVCPPVRMAKLGSHWTDFHEIWYLSIFRKKKYCWKHSYFIKIWQEWPVLYMQTDIHSRYCTWRPIYSFDHISLSSSLNAKWFGRKVLEKTKNTFCAQYIFFSENSGAYEIMWKIIIIIIITIIMFVNCNWVVTRWQWLFYM